MAAKLIDGLTAASGVELARTSLFELQVPGANATRKVTALQLMQMFPGAVLQEKETSTTTSDDTVSQIPVDGTVPQSGEGEAFAALDTAFTPLVATSIIEVMVFAQVGGSSGQGCIVALFKDAGASALQAMIVSTDGTAGSSGNPCLVYREVAGSTSARTYKIRYGRAGGSGASYFNKASSNQNFGAASIARMIIRELVPPA